MPCPEVQRTLAGWAVARLVLPGGEGPPQPVARVHLEGIDPVVDDQIGRVQEGWGFLCLPDALEEPGLFTHRQKVTRYASIDGEPAVLFEHLAPPEHVRAGEALPALQVPRCRSPGAQLVLVPEPLWLL